MMTLSVIVPVYNGEKTIKRCLLSLLNQDYSNMEILVINDGSDDNTLAIVNKISEEYPEREIRIINKRNQGLPQARKTGVMFSNGDYIGFVDADDWVEPEMYSCMLERAFSLDLDIVSCDLSYDYKNHIDVHRQKMDEHTVYNNKEAISAVNNRYGIFPNMCNKIIKKYLFENITFLHGNFCGEDYSILIQILQNKCNVGIVKKALYHYVQNDGSMGVGGYGGAQELGYHIYKRILYQVHKSFDSVTIKEYDNYFVNEFMFFVLAMGYNKNYDIDKIRWIQKFIKKRIVHIISNKHNTILCKGTSVVMCFSYKLVIIIFNFYRKFFVKWN